MNELELATMVVTAVGGIVFGLRNVGKASWGRFRRAGMTKLAFQLCNFALLAVVVSGSAMSLGLLAEFGLEPFALAYGLACLAVLAAWHLVKGRTTLRAKVFMSTTAVPLAGSIATFLFRLGAPEGWI